MEKIIWFDGTIVSDNAVSYNVDMGESEDCVIKIPKSIVKEIADEDDLEKSFLIALLLAYIEQSRQDTAKLNEKPTKKMKEGKLIETVKVMVEYFTTVDELIVKFQNLTYHKIVKIFDSKSPIEVLNKYS